MTILVLAEHDGKRVKPANAANAVTAATADGVGDVHRAGRRPGRRRGRRGGRQGRRRRQGAACRGRAHYANPAGREPVAPLIVDARHGLQPHRAGRRPPSARTSCRASPPCSTCSRSPTSSEVVSADTFVRPIYAGNALATVQSKDAIKVITVRATAFERPRRPAAAAAIEQTRRGADASGLSTFVGAELSKSRAAGADRRPRSSISGGRGMAVGRELQAARGHRRQARRRRRRHRAPRSMPASCRTTTRSARPARSSRPTSTSRSASPARSSISPA